MKLIRLICIPFQMLFYALMWIIASILLAILDAIVTILKLIFDL